MNNKIKNIQGRKWIKMQFKKTRECLKEKKKFDFQEFKRNVGLPALKTYTHVEDKVCLLG